MRLLLDTNLLIPLEDSEQVLEKSLAHVFRLAHEHDHSLLYHPASEDELLRDSNAERRRRNLDAIKQHTRLEDRPSCPWSSPYSRPNDACDNEILYALHCDAVHALITEDRGIVDKARARGLTHRVHSIQTAEDWLRRLYETKHVPLPEIEDVPLATLRPHLAGAFLERLRVSDPSFDRWIEDKAHEDGKAWVAWERAGVPGALCIYARQDEETLTEEGPRIDGPALELSAFTVAPAVRSRKIGEFLLKTAFHHATANRLENILIHGHGDPRHILFTMLEDFGFSRIGSRPGSNGRDALYLKHHPVSPPADTIEPLVYLKRFFPHFRHDPAVGKYIIALRPRAHRALLPDYQSPAGRQLLLFPLPHAVGSAIKLATLCHAQTRRINEGDVALFYRSGDERAITSLGVVEYFDTLKDADLIAARMKRRTVYSMKEIEDMARKPTRVMLFRLVGHLNNPLPQSWLEANGILNGTPQSIVKISDDAFERVLAGAG